MLTIAYMQAMTFCIHTQGRFTNHTACSLYRIMVTTTSVVGVVKMGNSVPRAGLESTSLAFQASMVPFHYACSLMSPLYPHLPICVVLCLRGQCRLLQYFNCKYIKLPLASLTKLCPHSFPQYLLLYKETY